MRALLLLLLNSVASLAFAQPVETEPDYCSGRISDVACYRNIIRAEAHRANVRDGHVNAVTAAPKQRMIFEGRKIILDTEDPVACRQVSEFILQNHMRMGTHSESASDLCADTSVDDRFREVTVMWEVEEAYFTNLNLAPLQDTDKNMVNDSRNLLFAMGVNIGLLWMAPESFSNFDKEKIREQSIFENWKDNVTRKPVMDKDGKLLNYVLHPLSGAIYYSIARSNGLSRWQSFGYSVMMSTFFWEYGIEATVERPSIQDLIATPVLGSILGEVGFYLAKKIENNGGKVLGSRKVGKLLMIILRPGESLVHGINKLLKKRAVQNAESQIVLARVKDPTRPGLKTNYIGLQLGFQF